MKTLLWMVIGLAMAVNGGAAENSRPNVVVLYADDLGYGDVSCYGNKTLQTPHMDRLAAEGMRFTDGHSAAATCTPSRYAMMTGEYAWRKKGTGILPGDAALIIEPGRETMATVFQKAGYRTGVVGKWHLGLGTGNVDWNGEIKPGPMEVGFDEAYIMAATGDRVPCVYLDGRRVAGLDASDPIQVSYKEPFPGELTGKDRPDLLRMRPSHGHDQFLHNGISRIGHMSGGKAALWKDEEMADVFTSKAISFLERNQAKPFFLFFAAHDPHVPRVPHPRFVGKSGMGPRGDAILQLDACVGGILDALDRLNLKEKTLVILTSDNGPVVDDGYHDEAVEKLGSHRPAGPLRGGKSSAFEGGTRVPFMVRWPERIKPGTSDALICQVDFLATFAALIGQNANGSQAPDSQNLLLALLGQFSEGRQSLVEQGATIGFRKGNWKLLEPKKGPKISKNTNVALGNAPEAQLYDLSRDLGEQTDLASQHPERVAAMAKELQAIKGSNPK